MAAASEEFERWINANGAFMHPQLSFFHALESGDRGVVAKERIKKGTELCCVPLDACIHMPTEEEWAEHQAGNVTLDEATVFLKGGGLARPLSTFLATTLLLLHELAKGEDSRFGAYLATMPTSPDCTLLWDDVDMAELAGTTIEGCGASSAMKEYKRRVKPVMQQRRDLWPAERCRFEEFQYAAGMVQSRSFHIRSHNWVTGERSEGEELFLIPGIDMLNHMTDDESSHPYVPNASLALSSRGTSANPGSQAASRQCFTMTADMGIRKGQEVLHTYGLLGNAALLQTYGFVEDRYYPMGLECGEGAIAHPYDRVELPVDLLFQAFRAQYPWALQADDDEDDPWEDMDGDFFELKEGNALPDSLVDASNELMQYYCVEMLPVLFRLVGIANARYKGTQREDEATLVEERCSGRLRKAIIVRVGERSVLESTKLALVNALAARGGRIGSDCEDDGSGSMDRSSGLSGDSSSDDDAGDDDEDAHAEDDDDLCCKPSWKRPLSRDSPATEVAEGEEEEQPDEAEEDASPEEAEEEGDEDEHRTRSTHNRGSGQASTSDLLSRSVLARSSGKKGNAPRQEGRRRSTVLPASDPVRKRLRFA